MCSEVTAQKGHCTNGAGGILCAGFEHHRRPPCFIIIADLLATISMVGLLIVLSILFQGARASAAAETERRRP